jgi:hypothetical protein
MKIMNPPAEKLNMTMDLGKYRFIVQFDPVTGFATQVDFCDADDGTLLKRVVNREISLSHILEEAASTDEQIGHLLTGRDHTDELAYLTQLREEMLGIRNELVAQAEAAVDAVDQTIETLRTGL